MSDLIPINIVVADRTYRLKTSKEHEESIRKTIKIINDKIIEFKMQFAGKDQQDYLAMVIVWYATQSLSGEASAGEQAILSEIGKMQGEIEAALL